jgi:hypothetical protein
MLSHLADLMVRRGIRGNLVLAIRTGQALRGAVLTSHTRMRGSRVHLAKIAPLTFAVDGGVAAEVRAAVVGSVLLADGPLVAINDALENFHANCLSKRSKTYLPQSSLCPLFQSLLITPVLVQLMEGLPRYTS